MRLHRKTELGFLEAITCSSVTFQHGEANLAPPPMGGGARSPFDGGVHFTHLA